MSAVKRQTICGLQPAPRPPEAYGRSRHDVRLLVSDADSDVEHPFLELPGILRAGDVLVMNDSATRRAAIDLETADLTLHLSSRVQGARTRWIGEFRRDQGLAPYHGPVPTAFHVAGCMVTVVGPHNDDVPTRLWTLEAPDSFDRMVHEVGRYVRYDYTDPDVEGWRQNVYRGPFGSAELASAGRPISREVLSKLRARGVLIRRLTLHSGVSSQDLGERPHPEFYDIGASTGRAIRDAQQDGRRVIAVGTTVVRAIETWTRTGAPNGFTDLILGPQNPARAVDAILSGFHPPQASHLDLLSAITGRQLVERAYDIACASRLSSHEFGDSHLLFGT